VPLRERGYRHDPVELYNIDESVVIEHIHNEYADAGAELLQSNTLGASPYRLKRFNLRDKSYEINRKGVWLARAAAARTSALVAAVVGPSGKYLHPLGPADPVRLRDSYDEQITALADGSPDLLLLKDFIELAELEIAIASAQKIAPHLPIIAMKTFPEDGALLATGYARRISERLQELGASAIGANGTVGPQRMLSIMKAFALPEIPLAAQPDVGIPVLVDGKPVYNATKEYVASSCKRLVESGIGILGVDGGATPEFVAAIARELASAQFSPVTTITVKEEEQKPIVINHKESYSNFKKNLGKKFLATVELDIPRGLDMSSVFEGASYLANAGIDAVNISDGARARLRVSSIMLSHLVQQQCGIEAITHFACRDRSMVGLQSELLGAEMLGVRNILAVTGDPSQIGDFPYATSVYDIDAIGLIRALNEMNHGRDLMGNPITGDDARSTHFLISCGVNPVADDMQRELDRLARKVGEGCEVIFTQPIFELSALETFLNAISAFKADAKVMLGILPLRSVRHSEFLHYEVPGISIPDWIHNRIARHNDVDSQSKEGIDICVEFLAEAKRMVDGVYLMPPFKKYSMAVEILQRIGA
jgi:homocysteine S-methyltransferase